MSEDVLQELAQQEVQADKFRSMIARRRSTGAGEEQRILKHYEKCLADTLERIKTLRDTLERIKTLRLSSNDGEKTRAGPGGGTWSTDQTRDVSKWPDFQKMPGVFILSLADRGKWSSVARSVDALNDGTLIGQDPLGNGQVVGNHHGLCVLFSASKDSYWLLWRTDKEAQAKELLQHR